MVDPGNLLRALDNLTGEHSVTKILVVTSMSISDENRRRLSTASRIVPKSDLTGDVLVGAMRDAIGARGVLPQ